MQMRNASYSDIGVARTAARAEIRGLNWPPNLSSLVSEFAEHGRAVIPEILSAEMVRLLADEVESFGERSIRKDFRMPQTGNTPRHLTVVGGAAMNQSEIIMAAYRDPATIKALSTILNERVAECPAMIESVIATILHEPGDTHGWHLDDYPVAFILGLHMPPEADGGFVELRREQAHERIVLRTGDGYLLRADRILHRVAPLNKSSRRVILNFTYAFAGHSVLPNGTAPLLCD